MPNPWVTDRALSSVARTRALGLHFFGHVLGISALPPTDGRACLRLDPPLPPGGPKEASPVDLTTTADLAMSLAIRRRLAAGVRLGTTTLNMQFVALHRPGPYLADARVLAWDVDAASAHTVCQVRDVAGSVVAAAQAWFVVLPLPQGRRLPQQRWELGDDPALATLSRQDLTDEERSAVTATCRAGRRAELRGISLADALVDLAWTGAPGGDHVLGHASPGPELANRVGHVQGGALYGMAAAAAQRVAGHGARLVDGHLQYLMAATEPALSVEASVLRRGRRAAFVEIGIAGPDHQVAKGGFTFRRRHRAIDM